MDRGWGWWDNIVKKTTEWVDKGVKEVEKGVNTIKDGASDVLDDIGNGISDAWDGFVDDFLDYEIHAHLLPGHRRLGHVQALLRPIDKACKVPLATMYLILK